MANELHENTNPAAQGAAPTEPEERTPTPAEWVLVGIGGLVLLWGIVCGLSAVWLMFQVPITPQDLQQASWLGSYVTATHFSGVLGVAFGVAMVITGLGMAVAKQSVVPLVPALLVGGALWANNEATMVRVGVWDGSIKIGCYVWEAKECREMLGVPADRAPSRYASPEERARDWFVDAEWYRKAKPAVPAAAVADIPGWYLAKAPFLLGHEAELKAKLAQQRAEVVAFQQRAKSKLP